MLVKMEICCFIDDGVETVYIPDHMVEEWTVYYAERGYSVNVKVSEKDAPESSPDYCAEKGFSMARPEDALYIQGWEVVGAFSEGE